MDWEALSKPWLEAAPFLEVALRPVQDALMDAADLKPGMQVLDVGFGTGPTLVMAQAALGDRGQLTGIDIAPPLVAHARTRVPEEVTLITGDAALHGFDATRYDVILSNFGIMFFEDTRAALANLRRAARPGGRFVATVWGLPKDNPYFSMPRQVAMAFLPDLLRPDPTAPGPMRFGDPSGVLDDFEAAGWSAQVATRDLMLTPPGAAEGMLKIHQVSPLGLMLADQDMADETRMAMEAALVDAYRNFETPAGMRIPARIHMITAQAV